jgi:hypothetical protein
MSPDLPVNITGKPMFSVQSSITMKEKRRYPRIHASFQTYIIDMDDDHNSAPLEMLISGRTVDISQRGVQIETPCRLKVGAFVMLLVYLNGNKSMCFCQVTREVKSGNKFLYGLFCKEWSYLHPAIKKILTTEPEWARWEVAPQAA